MFYCYVLRSVKSGRFYVGHCLDLDARLHDHNRGHVKSTRSKGPWRIVYVESFPTRAQAAEREREIKSCKSRKVIEALIAKG